MREDWAAGYCRNSHGRDMSSPLVFAALWNVVNLPLGFYAGRAWLHTRDNRLLLTLVFVAVGLWLMFRAWLAFRRWWKFRRVEFRLARAPAGMGGLLQGALVMPGRWDGLGNVEITLACVHEWWSGSGDDRTQRREVLWEAKQALPPPGGIDAELGVQFALPEGYPSAHPFKEDIRHVWELTASAQAPGLDFLATFEAPVFAVSVEPAEQARAAAAVGLQRAPSPFRTENSQEALVLIYDAKAYHRAVLWLLPALPFFGFVYLFLKADGADRSVLALTGFMGFVFLYAFLAGISEGSRLRIEGGKVRLRRLGLTRRFLLEEVATEELAPSVGFEASPFFNLVVQLKNGRRITLAAGLVSRAEAEAGVRHLQEALELQEP